MTIYYHSHHHQHHRVGWTDTSAIQITCLHHIGILITTRKLFLFAFPLVSYKLCISFRNFHFIIVKTTRWGSLSAFLRISYLLEAMNFTEQISQKTWLKNHFSVSLSFSYTLRQSHDFLLCCRKFGQSLSNELLYSLKQLNVIPNSISITQRTTSSPTARCTYWVTNVIDFPARPALAVLPTRCI